jgi:AcrR family transcriptional regulator
MKDTKERIVTESAKLFMRQGFDGTSVAEMGDAVGIAPSSIFSHYKSKEEVYKKAIERFVINMQSPKKKIGEYSKLTLSDFIALYLEKAEEAIIDTQELVQGGDKTSAQYLRFLLESTIKDPECEKTLSSFNEEELDMWTTVIKQAQGNGEVRNDMDARQIAEIFRYGIAGISYSFAAEKGVTTKQLKSFLENIYTSVKK